MIAEVSVIKCFVTKTKTGVRNSRQNAGIYQHFSENLIGFFLWGWGGGAGAGKGDSSKIFI